MQSEECDPRSLVAEAILIAGNLGHAMIEVECLDGTVTLMGNVESEQARLAAETIALAQAGVIRVINKLKINGLQAGNATNALPGEDNFQI
jgi:osmotically-inducible protein OsmY